MWIQELCQFEIMLILCYNTHSMILVTGGTGFIGRSLVKELVSIGKPVRLLLRPSRESPRLPRGEAVDVAVSSLKDEKGLRSALKGVDIIFHLAGVERQGSRSDLERIDVDSSRTLAAVAKQAGVERIFYISHLGADRSSAYPVLKAKALAEHFFLNSGVGYTIFRSGPVFGHGDQFTTGLANLLKITPGIFLVPGDGHSLVQPIWIDDLVACLNVALEDRTTVNQIFEIGGSEYLTFREILELLMQATGYRRILMNFQPAFLRSLTLWLEQTFPKYPLSLFWLDYLAADRTCPIDVLPRQFGVIPARFNQNLDYLHPGTRSKRILFQRQTNN